MQSFKLNVYMKTPENVLNLILKKKNQNKVHDDVLVKINMFYTWGYVLRY
jgi:hypothetical protein